MAFFFEHPIIVRKGADNQGGLNPGYQSLYFIHYIAFGAAVAVQVFLIIILSVLARHANLT